MLHKETVNKQTLELIQTLQSDNILKGFVLVGGTALAFHLGHRLSVDVDLFTTEDFDAHEMLVHLEQNYGFQEQYRHKNTLKGIINGVMVDMICHNYEQVSSPLETSGMRIASKQDIAAMKVNAISGNGTRIKDFIDIYFLLKEFRFYELIEFYKIKYKTRSDFHAIKSLTFFDDIIPDPFPQMIREKSLSLEQIKSEITQRRDNFLKNKQ